MTQMTKLFLRIAAAGTWAVLSCAGVAAHAQTETEAETVERVSSLRKQEDRVAAIGNRLSRAAAAAGWCEGGRSLGWVLADIGQYPKRYRTAVRQQWALSPTAATYIASVAPGGAAARAGLTAGLTVTSINGAVPARNTESSPSAQARMRNDRMVDSALDAGPLTIETTDAAGVRRSWSLTADPSCDTRFEVSADDDEQAYADGELVQVTAGMGVFTGENDQELAAVIAHELAHNIMRHVPRQRQAGTPNNYTRYLGRFTNINRSMEEEADRLSIWLLALAGYEARAPIDFWQRFGPGHDSAHPFGRTHDRWTDRVAALTDELARMEREKAANPDVRPYLLDRRDLVPVPGARPDINAEG